jgi:hypothetical protein
MVWFLLSDNGLQHLIGFMECVKVSLLIFGNKDFMKVLSYLYIYETSSKTWCMVEDNGQ